MLRKVLILCVGMVFFFNCEKEEKANNGSKVFSKLSSKKSGIEFNNILTENDTVNYFTYPYLYMGGGVSSGDINNDGLIDLFFTGNQVKNKLFLNKGNLQFEDITENAEIGGDDRWYTGVTMADVNADGYLDIYCSVSGKFTTTKNELYINNGDGTFTEKAEEYGLADAGNSIQSTFFDYDNDGDLDVFVANYPPTKFSTQPKDYLNYMKYATDNQTSHLYKNEEGKFIDATKEAGVRNYSLAIGITVSDVNNDGWQDFYVSNDFSSPDFLFLNNQDGTFKEVVKQAMMHNSYYGMGIDIADFNNDGFLDVFQLDMDPEKNRRKKANMASMNPRLFYDVVESGFPLQNMHNTFQTHTGIVDEYGIPKYANVSRLTGTSSTDWSWAVLFADLDNDGKKDLFITNGTRKEINHNDYFNSLDGKKDIDLLEASINIPTEKIDNYVFKNNGNYNFDLVNKDWGIEYKGFSNGAAYADLDNDGDLEIIINNIDDNVTIFENKSSESSNHVTVKFESETANKNGLGNRVYITANGETQMQELTLTRGFQSSVAPELHFGLGNAEQIDEIKIVWTDGKTQTMTNVPSNQSITFNHNEAVERESLNEAKSTLFVKETSVFPEYKHEENFYDDFIDQVLLPHKMSSFGPALAVGDLNGDNLDDYFIGGSKGNDGVIYYQTDEGFEKQSVFEDDKNSEDVGAHIFDADNDGDNDLYVVSGGYEFSENAPELQDRLYVNDGNGNFTKATLPNMSISGSKVYSEDFDSDGKQDLLVLGRQTPKNYPAPTHSYVLKNTSEKDNLSFEILQEFENLGMATSAVITDFDSDNLKDIVVVGEWMPIKAFKNDRNSFKEVTNDVGLDDTTGWFWSIKEGDFDNDGDIDFIVGNNGLNYKYQADEDATFDIYYSDFDKNNSEDIVLSYHNEGEEYPVRGRECSSQQIPGIKNKFKNYETFSEATLVDVYTEKELENSLHYQVKSFASVYLENKDGQFIIHKLPVEAQFSSINQILVDDYDNDGNLDALIAGNLYVSEVETPRNDGSYGLYLKGNGDGTFNSVPPYKSGFFTPGDVKDMAEIKVKEDRYIISAKNDDYLQFTKIVK